VNTPPTEVLQKRNAANRRLGWALGGVAFLLYAIGMFISR